MKRVFIGCLFSICLVVMTAGTGFGWAWGTHAFIVDSLGRSRLPAKSNEIYGSVAPDVFNFLFSDPPLMVALAGATHTMAEDVWDNARNQPEREFAFGFASHNEVWGADMTAHQYGLTLDGPDQGYVIAKAKVLLNYPDFPSQGYTLGAILGAMGLSEEASTLMAHIMVENAIDLMLAQQAPDLGGALVRAALYRNQLFPKLLVRAYGDLASNDLILSVEEGFRGDLIAYGQMLQQSPEVAYQMMAALLVAQAKGYLAMSSGVTIPDDASLLNLAKAGLTLAKGVCASDYMPELEATRAFVQEQLALQGVQD